MNPHPVPQVMPAPEEALYERLQSMYWDAATREVCNMIKFYNEMENFDDDIDEVVDPIDPNVFRDMFKVWSTSFIPQLLLRALLRACLSAVGGQSGNSEDSNYSYDKLLAETLSREKGRMSLIYFKSSLLTLSADRRKIDKPRRRARMLLQSSGSSNPQKALNRKTFLI